MKRITFFATSFLVIQWAFMPAFSQSITTKPYFESNENILVKYSGFPNKITTVHLYKMENGRRIHVGHHYTGEPQNNLRTPNSNYTGGTLIFQPLAAGDYQLSGNYVLNDGNTEWGPFHSFRVGSDDTQVKIKTDKDHYPANVSSIKVEYSGFQGYSLDMIIITKRDAQPLAHSHYFTKYTSRSQKGTLHIPLVDANNNVIGLPPGEYEARAIFYDQEINGVKGHGWSWEPRARYFFTVGNAMVRSQSVSNTKKEQTEVQVRKTGVKPDTLKPSIKVRKELNLYPDNIFVDFKNFPRSDKAFLSLKKINEPDGLWHPKRTTLSRSNGTIQFNPRKYGEGEFVVLGWKSENSGDIIARDTFRIIIPRNTTLVRPVKNIYLTEEKIEIQFVTFPGHNSDSITIRKAGQSKRLQGFLNFTNGVQRGVLQFPGINVPGKYEVRAYFSTPNSSERKILIIAEFEVVRRRD